MVQRAADYQTAKEVLVAVQLAQSGAASALIERVTGFGPRWVRGIVRENGGALARKPRDPLRWFEMKPQRLLHARVVQIAYERQSMGDSLGLRLLSTYRTYRIIAQHPGLLDINECAQVIDLYQAGEAWVRECTGCHEPHLVLANHALCPVCRLIAREFCRGCDRPLEQQEQHWKAYCDACSPRSVRLALRRRVKVAGRNITEPAHSPPTLGSGALAVALPTCLRMR